MLKYDNPCPFNSTTVNDRTDVEFGYLKFDSALNPKLEVTLRELEPVWRDEIPKNEDSARLYIYREPNGSCLNFQFAYLTWVSGGDAYDHNWAVDSQCNVEFFGECTWDGIRHMWMGDDEAGYLNYANLGNFLKALTIVEQLEDKVIDANNAGISDWDTFVKQIEQVEE